jgi:hypothetical protein
MASSSHRLFGTPGPRAAEQTGKLLLKANASGGGTAGPSAAQVGKERIRPKVAPLCSGPNEQLEAMIEYIKTSLETQARSSVRVIEGTIEPTSVGVRRGPLLDSPKPKNRVMLEADNAVGPRERTRKSPPGG